tara:strand:+ start:2276 stop:2947 length:672 start_codon:yes stop_codon:yes gene_type:complete
MDNKDRKEIASRIHEVAINPILNNEDLNDLYNSCKHNDIKSISSSCNYLPTLREKISPEDKISLNALIGFPFGDIPTSLKLDLATWAIDLGADSLEVVPNYFYFNSKAIDLFANEIESINTKQIPIRIIINQNYFDKNNIAMLISILTELNIENIQLGNGFGPKITFDELNLFKELCKEKFIFKVVGGIKTFSDVIYFLNNGVKYVGTSYSHEILQELKMQDV